MNNYDVYEGFQFMKDSLEKMLKLFPHKTLLDDLVNIST